MLGTILKIVTKVVGTLLPDKPKEIIKNLVSDTMKSDVEIQAELRELELLVENAKDQREVIKTALTSEDPYVRRSRPTFLWMMYIIFIVNFIIVPVIQLCIGKPMTLVELPTALYVLFGSGYLGYGILRSSDKSKNGLNGIINGAEQFLGIKKK